MHRSGRSTEAERQAARSLVLSGALDQRAKHLARYVFSGPPRFARPGMPPDMSPLVHKLLAEVDRHTKGRRWLAAVRAYEKAEQLARMSEPTIRDARQRERAEMEAQRREVEAQRWADLALRGKEAKRRTSAGRAKRYVSEARRLRRDHPEWKLHSISTHLHKHPPPGRRPMSIQQITRYLKTAGLK